MNVTLFGYPGLWGGANTECWHTLKLWRRHGVDVTCIPTWHADEVWEGKLAGIGVKTRVVKPKDLALPDGTVTVAFCSHPFLHAAGRLKNCRCVWVPCMNYVSDAEKRCYEDHGPFAAYVFQSCYQREQLQLAYNQMGLADVPAHHIHGAFDISEFPFRPRPHRNGDPFYVGRVSRPDPQKFSHLTWEIYSQIPNVRARVMGWRNQPEHRCGTPPPWAEVIPVGGEPVGDFMRSLHAIVHASGEAVENWPRFALEAFSTGVPVITDNRGGVREMVRHGVTGYLCDTMGDFVRYATELAGNENLRSSVVSRARSVLEEDLAVPGDIWARWRALFEELT